MYAKCSLYKEAISLFQQYQNSDLIDKNVVTAMINTYGMFSEGKKALELFYNYEKVIRFDEVTFGCLLNACR
jgi:hypothetical protein